MSINLLKDKNVLRYVVPKEMKPSRMLIFILLFIVDLVQRVVSYSAKFALSLAAVGCVLLLQDNPPRYEGLSESKVPCFFHVDPER
jgi:hypothetical protein